MRKNGVTICGFYGSYNLGDEAMLIGMMSLLREQNQNLNFTVFSNDPKHTAAQYFVQAIHRLSRKQTGHRLWKILQNRYFVLGGGDLLRDSANAPVALYWLQLLQTAIRLRRRTLVLGINVSEIWQPETKALIPKVLNQVDFLAVRDLQSKKKLEALGVQKMIHVMSDLALENVSSTTTQLDRLTKQPIHVGLSVRHLLDRGTSVSSDLYPSLLKEIAAIADFLVEEYGAIVHFLPLRTYEHSYHGSDDDYLSTLHVLRYSRYSSQFVIHRYFESVHQLTQLIETFNLLIGMRLHSLILSAGVGVPIIAMAYDPKVRGFMEEIGQTEFCLPLEQFEQETVTPLIRQIVNNQAAAQATLHEGVQQYRQRIEAIKTALKPIMNHG